MAIKALAVMKAQVILCAGDIADGSGSIDRCVQLLQENNVYCVMGNHDRWMLEGTMRNAADATVKESISPTSLTYLASRPATMEIPTPRGLLLLCHGLGPNDMRKLNEDDFDFPFTLQNTVELQDILRQRKYNFVVSGHSHRHWHRSYQGITFINAGTLKKEHNPVFSLLNTETDEMLWFNPSE